MEHNFTKCFYQEKVTAQKLCKTEKRIKQSLEFKVSTIKLSVDFSHPFVNSDAIPLQHQTKTLRKWQLFQELPPITNLHNNQIF